MVSLFSKFAGTFTKKQKLFQVFSCEFYEIFGTLKPGVH